MRGKRHDKHTKAQVVARLATGQRLADVAAAYNLAASTVRTWRRNVCAGAVSLDFSALLVEYLKEALITLRAQAKMMANDTWLRAQDARSLAILHGRMADQCLRMLPFMRGACGLEKT